MAVDDRVAPEPGDNVARKTRVSAFARTDLDEWLRDLGIDTLILAGISTSGVVLSTVCDAAGPRLSPRRPRRCLRRP